MISHETGFTALDMTDHVPFYPTLQGECLDFGDALFRIILPKDADPCFQGRLNNFNRLRFSHDDQTGFVRFSVRPAGCGCDSIQDPLMIFANGVNKFGHTTIIYRTFLSYRVSQNNVSYCKQINAPKRPVRPFSARWENQSFVLQAVQMPQTSIFCTPARSRSR